MNSDFLVQNADVLREVLSITGGRRSLIRDLHCHQNEDSLLAYAESRILTEKFWLLNTIGLPPKHGRKFSSEVSPFFSKLSIVRLRHGHVLPPYRKASR